MSGLPTGWTEAAVLDLLEPLSDGRLVHQGWSPRCETVPSSDPNDWGVLKTTAIQDGWFCDEHNKRLPDELDPRPLLEVSAGDLLMTCAGPRARCGVPALVRTTRPRLMISGKMYRMRPSQHAEPGYLEAALRTSAAQLAIDQLKTGMSESGMNLTHERFATLRIPVAPAAEQRRIVAKLDALTARTARARADLDRIPALAARYKQAVLAKAFSGELTAEWRARRQAIEAVEPRHGAGMRAKYKLEADAPEFSPPYNVPDGWRWLRLPELGELDRGKSRHRPRDDARLFGGAYPFVQTGEVRAAERYLTAFSKTYSDFGLRQSKLWPRGTVCITIAANIAESAVLGVDACFPDSVVGFVADSDRCLPEYVEYFVRTAKAELEQFAPATAQKNINLEVLGVIRVPTAPLEEQAEIVRRVDSVFAEIDRLSAEAAAARRLLDRLDQAILAKAFRGELVPQDPADEPASVLLEHIRAERAAAPKARRSRKAAE